MLETQTHLYCLPNRAILQTGKLSIVSFNLIGSRASERDFKVPGLPARVCFPFLGRELGGSHFSARGLIRGLDRSRFAPVIVLQHLDGPVFEHFQNENAELLQSQAVPEFEPGQAFGARALYRAIASAGGLAEFLRMKSIDIVHCNDGRANAVWSLPAKLAGARLIWHNRGNPDAKGIRYVAPFLPDRIISVSGFASPKPGALSAAAKNEVVYSPFDVSLVVDRAVVRSRLLAELKLAPQTKFIGYVGLLIDRKRPLTFVQAIAAMRKAEPRLPVVGLLFGEGSDAMQGRIRDLSKELGVEDCIRMMGFRSPGAEWIAACDVLMVTAIDEPFGRTLIEAMIVGTPVVATASGGNVEAISDGVNGLLVEPENAAALAAAALKVCTQPDVAGRLAAEAQGQAKAKFGETRHADAVMRIYGELLGAETAGGQTEPEGRLNIADGASGGVVQ